FVGPCAALVGHLLVGEGWIQWPERQPWRGFAGRPGRVPIVRLGPVRSPSALIAGAVFSSCDQLKFSSPSAAASKSLAPIGEGRPARRSKKSSTARRSVLLISPSLCGKRV